MGEKPEDIEKMVVYQIGALQGVAANNPPQIVRSRLGNSMLGSGPTTPQDYPE